MRTRRGSLQRAVFDLLELEGEDDLRPRPLLERRQALEQLLADPGSSSRRVDSSPMVSKRGTRSCGATMRAWSPGTLRQPTRLAARCRGSRSSSGATVKRLEASTSGDPTYLA